MGFMAVLPQALKSVICKNVLILFARQKQTWFCPFIATNLPTRHAVGHRFFFGDNEGKKLAEKMQLVLNDFTNNSHSALKGDYFMLKCTTSPSVIVECGFLSNPADEAKLCDKNYRSQLAKVVYKGVLLYLADGVVNDTV